VLCGIPFGGTDSNDSGRTTEISQEEAQDFER